MGRLVAVFDDVAPPVLPDSGAAGAAFVVVVAGAAGAAFVVVVVGAGAAGAGLVVVAAGAAGAAFVVVAAGAAGAAFVVVVVGAGAAGAGLVAGAPGAAGSVFAASDEAAAERAAAEAGAALLLALFDPGVALELFTPADLLPLELDFAAGVLALVPDDVATRFAWPAAGEATSSATSEPRTMRNPVLVRIGCRIMLLKLLA